MKIRLVQPGEAHKLVEMGELFFKESQQPGEWNPQHFVAAWEKGISSGSMFVLVADDGSTFLAAIGATVGQCPNTGDILVGENFWFSRPAFRGRALELVDAYEVESKKRGAKRVWMMCLESLRPDVLGRLYKRRGYTLAEHCYWKGI